METEKDATGANVVQDTIIAALIYNQPTNSTKHIINGSDAQYSASLHGTGINNDTGEVQYCQPALARKSRSSGGSSSSSRRKETLEAKKCGICSKDCLTPNNLMAAKVKECIIKMSNSDFTNRPHHFRRNEEIYFMQYGS